MKQLQKLGVIASVATKWYELGVELLDDDQTNQLDIIKENYSDITKRCYDMFKYWLNSHPTASWHKLVNALKQRGIEKNTVADSLERSFAT